MNADKCVRLKEAVKAIIKEVGEPDSRHMSIVRTSLEDAVLRLDCELRVQGAAPVVIPVGETITLQVDPAADIAIPADKETNIASTDEAPVDDDSGLLV